MAKLITAPPTRTGGKRAPLPELTEIIGILEPQDNDTPPNARWIRLDHAGVPTRRNRTQNIANNYKSALEGKFGYKITTRCFTDPEDKEVYRIGLAFTRDDDDKMVKVDDDDATASDGKPAGVETD